MFILLVINVFPVGDWIFLPLEERFSVDPLPEKVDGIIVLGGAVNAGLTASRKQPNVSGSAERLFSFVFLARQYPDAKLIFTGGSGNLSSMHKHSSGARTIFEQLGMDVDRIIFETESRNTYENAINSFDMVKPNSNENWVLITSAFHMPRSAGVFKKANWRVIPYPVDYQTKGYQEYGWHSDGLSEIEFVAYGLREWLGLVAYWISGKTENIFPGPDTK